MFEKVGIRLTPKIVKSTVGQALDTAGEFELNMTRQDFLASPYTSRRHLLAFVSNNKQVWRKRPLRFEERMVEIVEALKYERTREGRQELFASFRSCGPKTCTIGVIEGIYNTGITKRFSIPIEFGNS